MHYQLTITNTKEYNQLIAKKLKQTESDNFLHSNTPQLFKKQNKTKTTNSRR